MQSEMQSYAVLEARGKGKDGKGNCRLRGFGNIPWPMSFERNVGQETGCHAMFKDVQGISTFFQDHS